MTLIPEELLATVPPMRATEFEDDARALVKLFTPDSNMTWYVTEYDPAERLCFGLVVGFECELGYFSLDELEQVRGKLGLPVERDEWFKPTRLSVLKSRHRG